MEQTQDDSSLDEVTDEVSRWAALAPSVIEEFTDRDGVVNEFALMYRMRNSFPLHVHVFRQVSSHMGHEANTEQLFSLAGRLSDENGRGDPERLGVWASIAANASTYMPTHKQILQRYMSKFAQGGVLSSDHDECALV